MASAPEINQFNSGYMQAIGKDGRYNRDRIFSSLGYAPTAAGDYGQGFSLDDQQRKQVQAALEREGIQFPKGVEIDHAGNMNENEGAGKQFKKWGPIVGAGALAAFGMPGLFPGLLSGGGAAAAGGAASAIPGASAAPSLTSLLGAAPAGAAGAGSTGMFGALAGLGKSFLSDPSKIAGAAGAMLGGAGQAAASNRGAQMDAMVGADEVNRRRQRDFYDFLLAREQEGRAGSTDAMRKLQQGEYMAGGGSQFKPGKYSYGFGPQTMTGAEKAGGSAVSAESLARLQGGNPMPMPATPQPFTFGDLTKSGWFEKLANIAGPGLTAFGSLSKLVK